MSAKRQLRIREAAKKRAAKPSTFSPSEKPAKKAKKKTVGSKIRKAVAAALRGES